MTVVLDTAMRIAAERGAFDMPACLAALGDAPVALVTLNLEEFRRVSGLQVAELAPDDTEI